MHVELVRKSVIVREMLKARAVFGEHELLMSACVLRSWAPGFAGLSCRVCGVVMDYRSGVSLG